MVSMWLAQAEMLWVNRDHSPGLLGCVEPRVGHQRREGGQVPLMERGW